MVLTGEVAFEWAWFGKVPGRREDYDTVRASSGPVLPATMKKIILHYWPGAPSGPATGQPDDVPWVVFSATEISGIAYVSVAIREWPADPSTDVDADGRTIITTRFFCVPKTVFTRELGSYLTLYDAVRDVELRDQTGLGPVTVPIRRRQDRAALFGCGPGGRAPAAGPSPESPRETAEGWDSRTAAVLAAAAILLDRPVTIVLTRLMDLTERITFLDQVAALVPAGARCGDERSAATWADVRGPHHIRLVFGQDAGDDRTVRLDLGHPPALAALVRSLRGGTGADPRSAAASYGEVLRGLLGAEAPGGASRERLAGLVDALAKDATACAFSQPDTLVNVLARAAGGVLAAAARAGTAGLDEVRGFLRTAPRGADPRGSLLGVLATSPAAGDAALAVRHWPAQAGPGPARLARELAARGYRNEVLAALAAAPAEVTAAVVDTLLAPPPLDERSTAASVDLALDLLAAHDPTRRADGPWERVRSRLGGDPDLAVRVFVRQLDARDGRGLTEFVRWIDPGGAGPAARALRPYRRLLAHPGVALDDSEVAWLGQSSLGDRALHALLALAIRHDRVRDALPAIGGWLSGSDLSPARRASWRALAETMGNRRDRALALRVLDPSAPAELAVHWVDADRPAAAERALAAAALHRRPTVSGVPNRPEASFVGDGDGRVVTIVGTTSASRGTGGGPSRPRWVACHGEYAGFIAAGGQVTELCRAAVEASRRGEHPDTLELARSRGPVGEDAAATLVDQAGFGLMADLAARLLQGPVAVVVPGGPSHLALDTRLDVLAGVLALLPAGAASALTTATWSDDPEPFRLAFTGRPPADRRHQVTWPPGAPPGAPPGLAGLYAARLRWVRAVRADTATIVRGLAGLIDPVDLDDVDAVLAVVAAGSNPVFSWLPPRQERDLREARARRRAAFGGQRFDTREIADVLAVLLADGTLADLESTDRLARRLLADGTLARVLTALQGWKDGSNERQVRARQGAAHLSQTHLASPPAPSGHEREPASMVARGRRDKGTAR